MLVIPSIDLEGGRSRVVYWPGASAGIGAPTDRPERIVERLVAQGARLIHLVDFEGARAGSPASLDVVGADRVADRGAACSSPAASIRPRRSSWRSRREPPGSC